jgi:hypothetical protein
MSDTMPFRADTRQIERHAERQHDKALSRARGALRCSLITLGTIRETISKDPSRACWLCTELDREIRAALAIVEA